MFCPEPLISLQYALLSHFSRFTHKCIQPPNCFSYRMRKLLHLVKGSPPGAANGSLVGASVMEFFFKLKLSRLMRIEKGMEAASMGAIPASLVSCNCLQKSYSPRQKPLTLKRGFQKPKQSLG